MGQDIFGGYQVVSSGLDQIVGDQLGSFDPARARAVMAAMQGGYNPHPGLQQLNPNALAMVQHAAAIQQAVEADRVAQIARPQEIGVRPQELGRGGEIPAGFQSDANVDPGDQVTIEFSAPVLFKPTRLLIPGSIAPQFTLNSCIIGLNSQLLTADPVPCEAYIETSINQGWRMPTLQVGQKLVMVFENVSLAAARLRGAWHGLYAT